MAHKECNCCHKNNSSSGSFMFGIIIGAIAGAIIAILIYRNNKNEVIETLKKKIESFFKSFTSSTFSSTTSKKNKKKPITSILEEIKEPQVSVTRHRSAPKMFVKPKK
jgi:gas vesicle protein